MILINARSQYAKAERLVSELNEEVMSWIDSLEESGWIVLITNLPFHIDSHEVYAAILLDQLNEMYLPETQKSNEVTKFH